MPTPEQRDIDVVLFGATGFTGALTAAYLAEHCPPGTRFALAGRNQDKLATLRDQLTALRDQSAEQSGDRTDPADIPVLHADVTDEASLRRVAESARVVISTVGPYIRYGEPIVAACAAAGTDYVDLTGEPEFVDLMYLHHHSTAQRTGARLVHACGFDSIPYDLGALYTVQQLPADQPIRLRGYVRAGGTLSGGTFDSAVTAFSRIRRASAVHAERRRAERRRLDHVGTGAALPVRATDDSAGAGEETDQETGQEAGQEAGRRRVRAVAGRPGYDRAAGSWVLPMPTIDPQIVVRSARALDQYGPDFTYSHYLAMKNPVTAVGLTAGVAGVFALAQFGPSRRAVRRLRPAGSGPDAEQRERGWFKVKFVADTPDRRLVTEVAGGDPGYGETAKMLAESALCLATDDLPEYAGQLTTAVAMGDALRVRLERAGISFRVLDGT